MRINATFDGDLKGFKLDEDKKTGFKTITLKLACSVTKDQAPLVFGEDFTRVAFSEDLQNEEGDLLYETIKPRLASEAHLLTVLGRELHTVPAVTTIKRDRKFRGRLDVSVEFPVEFSEPALAGELAERCFGPLEVTLTPAQTDLFDNEGDNEGDSGAAA